MYSFDLLIRARDAWLMGRWNFLRKLSVSSIQNHPDRADLAMLIASAWQQVNDAKKVKTFISLALSWGSSHHLLSQFLVAGVYNTLGCAKALRGDINLRNTFEQAVAIDEFSDLDLSVLASFRIREQLKALEGVSSFAGSLLFESLNDKGNAVTSIGRISTPGEVRGNQQLIVLGMHRSGTSCVTNLLRSMGAYFGSSDISTGQNEENPKGFWERRDMRNITDELLFSVNADWHKVSNFYPEDIPGDVLHEALNSFDLILNDLNRNDVWVLKEPRLCLLLPLLRSRLKKPLAVCVYRNPIEVALSLQVRNGFPLAFGLALWEFYTISMLRNTSDINRIFVSYNDLIKRPIEGAADLKKSLGNLGVSLSLPKKAELLQVVDSTLYRNKVYSHELENILTISQFKLFDRLNNNYSYFDEEALNFNRDQLETFEVLKEI